MVPLARALVYHVAIGANVPVREITDWLASLGGALVVEFATREGSDGAEGTS